MKCKKVLGMRVCRLNSAEVVQFPNSVENKVPVTIYTSKNCKICGPIVNKQFKVIKPLKGLVETRIVDIDKSNDIDPNIMTLPAVKIGDYLIGSNPSDRDIVNVLRKYIKS